MSTGASTPTDDNLQSMASNISEDSCLSNINSIFADPNIKRNTAEKQPTNHAKYEMEEVRNASTTKDNIIKILHDQLNSLHRKHKETIDEIESLKIKYENALDDLDNLHKINAQYESELKRSEHTPNKSDGTKKDGNFDNANLQDIATKIADVEDKVELVKRILSESDMPENVSNDVEKVNNEFKNLLMRQYTRIEDILNEHSIKLDAIRGKVCDDFTNPRESKIRFSTPNISISNTTSNKILETGHIPFPGSTKLNLLVTLRKTNDILSDEIEDLRNQLQFYRQALRLGVAEFIEDVIEIAQLTIEPSVSSNDLNKHRTEIKLLHERNNLLQIENIKLKEVLHNEQDTSKDVDKKCEELGMLHEQDLTNVEPSVEALKFDLQNFREALQLREDTIDELEGEIEELNSKLAELSNDNKEQDFQAIVDTNLQLSSEKLDTLKQQLDRISLQKQDTETILNKTILEKEGLNRNITVMSNTMQQYKNELDVKQAECVKYKEQVQRLEEQVGNFHQEMMEKDLVHERQMASHKDIITDMEGKYRTSKEEMEQLRDTSQKLIALKEQNEELVDEVEQLSVELEKFKGFECKDHSETDKQMQKLQCFCKKLEEKLENAKAEMSSEDDKKSNELKQQLKEKAILQKQTSVLKEEILKREEGSKGLLVEVDNYKDVIKGLTKTIQQMKKELDKYRCNKNPYRPEDIICENNLLKEEMRERNCEITNLRLTLEEYNRCHAIMPINVRSCKNVPCLVNQIQIPSCEDSTCAMNELRRLKDDMMNAQSKISSVVNCNQQYSALLQNGLRNCCLNQKQQQYVCAGQSDRCALDQQQAAAATVDKLKNLKGRVENLNHKEQELQYLVNELQRQNKKISRRCKVYGNACYSNNEQEPNIQELQKLERTKEPSNYQTSPSISNDPLFKTYHNQLENAVTKYKHVQEPSAQNKLTIEQLADQNMETNAKITAKDAARFANDRRGSVVSKVDSLDTTRSQIEKRKSLGFAIIDKQEDSLRRPRVSIKMYHDELLYPVMSGEFDTEEDEQSPFLRLQSPIPLLIDVFEPRCFEPLHFNTFYSRIPVVMYARREKNKLTVYANYNYGCPLISGGPLKCPYKFWQLHFHWGDDDSYGSEHTVENKHFIMEMHAIHIKENATIDQALKDPDGFVTVAYFYRYSAEDDDDIAMISIIQNFQRFDLRPDDDTLEFMAYFPLELLMRPFEHQYVTYRGSRTDGSKVENVIWIIAPFTNKISRSQMEEMRSIKSQVASVTIRKLQNANNRMVVYAEAEDDVQPNPIKISSNIFLPINIQS